MNKETQNGLFYIRPTVMIIWIGATLSRLFVKTYQMYMRVAKDAKPQFNMPSFHRGLYSNYIWNDCRRCGWLLVLLPSRFGAAARVTVTGAIVSSNGRRKHLRFRFKMTSLTVRWVFNLLMKRSGMVSGLGWHSFIHLVPSNIANTFRCYYGSVGDFLLIVHLR